VDNRLNIFDVFAPHIDTPVLTMACTVRPRVMARSAQKLLRELAALLWPRLTSFTLLYDCHASSLTGDVLRLMSFTSFNVEHITCKRQNMATVIVSNFGVLFTIFSWSPK